MEYNEKGYDLTFQVRYGEIGENGVATLAALGNWLQEAAGLSADSLGFGESELLHSHVTWILTRLVLRIARLPRAGESLRVHTWPSTAEKLAHRGYEVFDGEGRLIVSGGSAWTAMDLSSRVVNGNYALGKTATVSALEVDDGRFTPDLALDGNPATRLSFSAKADYQWMIVDLGSVRTVNKVVIQFNEHISDYVISVSEDGENYTEVAHVQKGEDRAKQTDTEEFSPVKARYIKYEQKKRFYIQDWNAYYSGGIIEFEVYGFNPKEYNELVNKALDMVIEGAPASLKTAMQRLENYLDEERIYDTHLAALVENLQQEMSAFEASKENVSDTSSHTDVLPVKKNNLGLWIGLGVAAAAVAAAAAYFIFKKKK